LIICARADAIDWAPFYGFGIGAGLLQPTAEFGVCHLAVAGTAWLFARDDMVNKLDYLFVDEAGQVSLANLAGMSRCARNVILMGDQMQLEQPIQGSHPGESGMSVLNYYLMGHATIPDELGLFLGTSFRMHPDVCQFVSEMVYEGRLQAAPENKIEHWSSRLQADDTFGSQQELFFHRLNMTVTHKEARKKLRESKRS